MAFSEINWTPGTPGFGVLRRLPVASGSVSSTAIDVRIVPYDAAEAVYWYRKAAEQGDADAQFRLGLMHAKGRGVLKEAFRLKQELHRSGSISPIPTRPRGAGRCTRSAAAAKLWRGFPYVSTVYQY